MYEILIASNKPVFKSPLFLLALFLPILSGLILALLIAYSDNLSIDINGGKKAIEIFWEYMKVPIAVSSLSIPLASWVIANHRSTQLVDTLHKQETKRLHDLYYDHADYFVKTFGRFIKTHGWHYLEEEDLFLVHRRLYHHNIASGNDSFEANIDIIDFIKKYSFKVKKESEEFLIEFEKENLAVHEKTNQIFALTMCLRECVEILSPVIGSKPLERDVCLQVVLNAIIEVASLYRWVHQIDISEFNPIDETKLNVIAKKAMDHLGLSEPKNMKPSYMKALCMLQEQKLQNGI